ncbi:UDP-N-acetylmuramoyl-L-alanyl-D-glutamate--2,6-diaminopimelate ligase [Desulfospira joergensenii]|uniref:UDP-N-acetylmuramoyl-L-alanyl-D-glutamate--2, 6-diaminopimelate ligase n=1 Tax=Desulfospira joergensenii TaxID=53329 RepID=UPI0003B41080|nr:UDP-N-acetylmuramoyl-L-alanyl-D-glutamate--2,6-diaminopimelate ligase [Desulfospira joergensenii]
MKLLELIKPLHGLSLSGISENPEIVSIRSDSRDIKPNSLFIAVKGHAADGHDYIDQALEKKAAAVIAQENPHNRERVILVKDSRQALAALAARFYGNPSKEMTLVGITGTNGKTTITWMLESIFKSCGFNCGVMGTVNIRYGGKILDNPVTTPDPVVIQRSLAEMKASGITHVIMEVSSHGLDQRRVDGCEFKVGVFTNLTQDHLDYHSHMDDYFQCKRRFFTDFIQPAGAIAVINTDHEYGKKLFASLPGPGIPVGQNPHARIRPMEMKDDITGLSGFIAVEDERFAVKSPLTGRFNLENILCAAGAAHALGISPGDIRAGLESCTRIPGRLEKVPNDILRHLFVDYAHTPDALESILSTLRERAPKRLITVFGCGGDRDRSKRPLMGKIACRYSDLAIVTSDNPRTENPKAIVQDIVQGIREESVPEIRPDSPALKNPKGSKKGFAIQADRKKALKMAVMVSRPGDIIVAAGKGHETYQITNSGTIHFDDREELALACDEFKSLFKPIEWSLADLEQALGLAPAIGSLPRGHRFQGIGTDSRSIESGQIFLALQGENFDAHKFIPDLIRKGIQGFVAREDSISASRIRDLAGEKGIALFQVSDTLKALGQLARYQRIRSGVKVLGITGSNGKTSTRKIAQEIFKKRFHILATQGNLNNEIGVPLTLLRLSAHHEWAIVEMGMNHAGEISRLSSISRPDIALVTNTAGAHLEGLETHDNIARAKAEIFEHAGKESVAVIFGDDPRADILIAGAEKNPDISGILLFGTRDRAGIRAESVEIKEGQCQFSIDWDGEPLCLTLPSPAPFMVNNSLAAIGAAKLAGIGPEDIRAGLMDFTPVSGRLDIIRLTNGIHLIDDSYNANPASMTQALKILADQAREKTAIAVLGDMLELGEDSGALHYEIGKTAAGLSISRLFLFGPQSRFILKGALENGFPEEHLFHGSKEEISQKVLTHAAKDDWILVKGSRGMAMETVIARMKNQIKNQINGQVKPENPGRPGKEFL